MECRHSTAERERCLIPTKWERRLLAAEWKRHYLAGKRERQLSRRQMGAAAFLPPIGSGDFLVAALQSND